MDHTHRAAPHARHPRLPAVAIIGGGFCGAMCALHLLRDHAGQAFRLDLFEPRAVLGAGLAYSTTDPQHRINVAASRMSPFIDDDLHLDRWLRTQAAATRDPLAELPDGRLFVQRAEIGRYVDQLLRAAVRDRPGIAFAHIRQLAVAARLQPGGFTITTRDGGCRRADVLVLAVGHPPPVLLPALCPLAGDKRLVADPWDAAALDALPRTSDLLILGTGLTACDVVASLRARGQTGRITAVSRRGLLPRARTAQPVEPEGDFSTEPAGTARDLLRRTRAAVATARAAGRPWENVIDALRRQGREVWGALPPPERLRFLRHLRAFWDVHRFQSAPQIADLIARELDAGTLRVRAASVRRILPRGDALVAHLQPRRAADGALTELRVGGVIACVGPGHADVVASNELLHSLAEAGMLRADPYGLGIEVDAQARCIDIRGGVARALFVAGPLARGTDGELMGLPQVSTQPRAVAGRVAALLAASPLPGVAEDALLDAVADANAQPLGGAGG